MIRPLRHTGLALVALLLLALTATGLAHRSPSVAAEQLAALARIGVTLDDICGMSEMAGTTDPCPLCRIEPGYLPPAPPRLAGIPLTRQLGVVRPILDLPQPALWHLPGKGPRAPPSA